MVCKVGFEPTTPRFQAENSDQTELLTEMFGASCQNRTDDFYLEGRSFTIKLRTLKFVWL